MTQKTPDHTLTPRQTFSRRRCCRTLLVWIAPLLLIVALHTRGQLLRTELYPHALFLLAAGALALWLWRSRGSATMDFARARPFIPLLIGLVLCLFASVTLHRWFFFLNWAPLTSWSSLSSVVVANRGLSGFVALTLLLTPFLARGLRRPWRPVLAILLLAEALCIAALMLKTSGAALYRIDHPSFMLRLWEFSHQFPQLVNYMPHWNGGVLHQASVITGVAGPGLALWPLFRFFPIENIYTPAWAILFLVIVPWLAVASVRALGGDRTAAFTGGILGLGVSQHFFLWGLHYGTIGASFASAMTMPVCALGFRAIWLRKINIYTALGLILAGTLLLMWPPCGIVALAVALSALCSASRWSRRTLTFLTLCAAAILTLFSPWLLAVLAEGKTEIAFVGQTAAPSDAKFQALLTWAHFCSGADHLAAHLREFNPVLLFLGLLGAALGPSRALRRWFLPILLVLAAVTGWAREFLPHGQLSRMSIPLAFAAVPPAALYLGRLLRTHDVRLAALRAALLALLILSGLSVRAITGNRGLARYATMPEDARGLADWISTNTPPDGRVLFAGHCVHGYGGGNVAFLPLLTHRHMLAADYYGFPLKLIPRDFPPPKFLQSPESLQLYLDAYNVSHVATYHDRWKTRLKEYPDAFTEVAKFDRISVFARKSHPGLFWQGAGTVSADVNHIAVTLTDAMEPAVIAYNWVDGLYTAPPATIAPHLVTNGITLIKIEPRGETNITIGFHPHLWRTLLGESDAGL